MLLAVVGSSSISSTRIAGPPRSCRIALPALNGLEASINHSRSEGKRLILCNSLDSLSSLQGSHKSIHSRYSGGMLADRILFIDAEGIVLDKPAGLPVDAPRRGGDSLVARLDELCCGFKRPP